MQVTQVMQAQLGYSEVLGKCKDLFSKKYQDYGEAWRILRPISLIDQIYIKGYRIRTIQEKGLQLVPDTIQEDLLAIINYSLLGLINERAQTLGAPVKLETLHAYDAELQACQELYAQKNHDYGNIWQSLSLETCVDFILMKSLRMRSMRQNNGPKVSEGYAANYRDIINYAVFGYLLSVNLCESSS